MIHKVALRPARFEPGDYLPALDLFVVEVWHDPEGTWVEYSDGEAGYVWDETRTIAIERTYDE